MTVLAYVGGEFAAKRYAESSLAMKVVEEDPVARQVKVRVSAPLLFRLMTNRAVDHIFLSASHVDVGPFLADKVGARIDKIKLDVGRLLRHSEAVITSIDRVDSYVEVSQAQASKVLPPGFRFEFTRSGVVVKGAGVVVKGRFKIVPPAEVVFELDPGATLPAGMAAPSWTFERIPFVTCLETLAFEPGLLRITCSNRDPVNDFPT